MSKQVDFYFDYGSPTSYLAYTQLPSIVKRTGATVNYKPILLGGIFMATGNKSPAEIPQKKNWMTQDLQNFARQYGVPLRWNQYFPINTLALMRGAIFAQRENFLLPYSDAIFKSIWVDDLNMGDPQQIGNVLKSAGLDAGKIFCCGRRSCHKGCAQGCNQQRRRAWRIWRTDVLCRGTNVFRARPPEFCRESTQQLMAGANQQK